MITTLDLMRLAPSPRADLVAAIAEGWPSAEAAGINVSGSDAFDYTTLRIADFNGTANMAEQRAGVLCTYSAVNQPNPKVYAGKLVVDDFIVGPSSSYLNLLFSFGIANGKSSTVQVGNVEVRQKYAS